MLSLLVLFFVFGLSRGDYPCLCSYDVEKQVYSSPAQSSRLIGYLYEFDCKPYLSNGTGDPNIWAAIAFDKQFGYVELDQQTTKQICPGDPSVSDALTTTQSTTITSDQTTVTTSEMPTITFTMNVPNDTSSNPTTTESITTTKAANPTTASTFATNTTLSPTISSSALTTNKSTTITSVPTFTTEVSTLGTNTTLTLPSSTMGAKSTLTLPTSTVGTKSTQFTVSSKIPDKNTTYSSAKSPVTFKLVTTTVPSTISTTDPSRSTTPVLTTRSVTNVASTKASTTLSPSSKATKLSTLLATQTPTVIQSTMSAKPTPTILKTPTTNSTKPSTTMSSIPTTSKSTAKITTAIRTPKQTTSQPTVKTTTVVSTPPSTPSPATVSSDSPSMMSSSKSIRTLPTTTATVTSAFSTTQGLIGDVSLCPTTQRQYAQKYGDIIAQYGNSCYTVINQKAAWEHAENICRSHGGHLLHIANKDENDFIYRLLHEKFSHAVWIGLQDFDREEHFKWTSGDPVTYTNWVPGRKNNRYSHYEEDCVEFIPYQGHGQWDDLPCGYYKDDDYDESEGYTKNFICEHTISNQLAVTSIAQTSKLTSSPSTMTSTSSSSSSSLPVSSGLAGNIALCPESQRNYAKTFGNMIAQYKGSCYSVIDFKASWDHAEDICVRQGGHLFHISSQDENDFIYNLLHDRFSHSVWMGLHDTDREEHFKWTSGVHVTYTHWLPGRKGNHEPHKEEDCVEFIPYRNHGAWDDIPCGEYNLYSQDEGYTKNFICQNSIVNPGSSTQILTSGNPCTPKLQAAAQQYGGILANHGNSCYVLEPRDSTWVDAEKGCRKYGGHLVQIGDQKEQDFIQNFVKQYDPREDVWIGLHDQDQEDAYIWTSYQPVTYTNWVPGHQSDDFDDCVVLMPFKQGQWHDVPCGDPDDDDPDPDTTESHHFICEFGATATSTGSVGPVLIGK